MGLMKGQKNITVIKGKGDKKGRGRDKLGIWD